MIWELLCRITPSARWFVGNLHNKRCWRYRIGLLIFSRAWWHEDRAVGLRHFPHFMAAQDRVERGQSILWPRWEESLWPEEDGCPF